MAKETSTKKLLMNSAVYSIMGLLQKCVSFFLLPLYTAYLSTEDYGIINVANNFTNTMTFIVAFSIFSAVMRFYVDLKDNREQLKRFYGTVTVFAYISSLLWGALATIGREILEKYIFVGTDYYPIILVCLLSLMFSCQQRIYDTILRSQQKAAKSSILTFLYFILNISLAIIFVVFLKMGAVGVLLANLIAYIVYSIYAHLDLIIKKEITICFDFKLLIEALKYSIPIIPHNLSTTIAALVSSILIGGTASLASLGVYSVAAQFGNIADTVQNYVSNAYGPWLYEKLHAQEEGYKKSIQNVVRLIVCVIGLCFVGISLFSQDYILLFLEKGYSYAWHYVPLVVCVYCIKIPYYFYVSVLFYYKKASRLLFTATLSSSIINILLSSLLIPRFNVYGSIIADAISMLIRVAIIITISKKFDDIGLYVADFLKQGFIIVIFALSGFIFQFAKYEDVFSWRNFVFKWLIVFIYITVCVFANFKQMRLFIKLRKNI